jgi:hypothetical protein
LRNEDDEQAQYMTSSDVDRVHTILQAEEDREKNLDYIRTYFRINHALDLIPAWLQPKSWDSDLRTWLNSLVQPLFELCSSGLHLDENHDRLKSANANRSKWRPGRRWDPVQACDTEHALETWKQERGILNIDYRFFSEGPIGAAEREHAPLATPHSGRRIRHPSRPNSGASVDSSPPGGVNIMQSVEDDGSQYATGKRFPGGALAEHGEPRLSDGFASHSEDGSDDLTLQIQANGGGNSIQNQELASMSMDRGRP